MKNTLVKRPKHLLLSIILLTLSAVMSTCTLLWITGANPWYTLIIGTSVGFTGIYAYNDAAMLILHIKCSGIPYDDE